MSAMSRGQAPSQVPAVAEGVKQPDEGALFRGSKSYAVQVPLGVEGILIEVDEKGHRDRHCGGQHAGRRVGKPCPGPICQGSHAHPFSSGLPTTERRAPRSAAPAASVDRGADGPRRMRGSR